MSENLPHGERRARRLTEGDVDAIVDALEQRMTEKFYSDLGRGLWGYVRRGLIYAALAIAAYGAWRGLK